MTSVIDGKDIAMSVVERVAAVSETLVQKTGVTPVPGDVGPMTIAMSMANAVIAAHGAADVTPSRFRRRGASMG